MKKLVDSYLTYLENEKQVSFNTYTSYKRDLKKFLQYLEKNQVEEVHQINPSMIQDYMNHMTECNYAPTTVTRSYIAIKSFFKYLHMTEVTESNPICSIQLPKMISKPNAVLTKDEMRTLLNPPVAFSFKGLRDRSMLLLLYGTKISISELVRLKVSAIDFEHQVMISMKDGQKREYPLQPETLEALTIYIDYKKLKEEEWLFPNRYGNPMSRQGFWKTIKNYTKDLGIDKEITLYSIKQGEI